MSISNDSGSTAAGFGGTDVTDDVLVTRTPPVQTTPGSGGGTPGDKGRQVAAAAGEQAREVAGTAKGEASAVAGTAQEQAQNVLAEAKDQAGDLFEDLRRQLTEQSDAVRDRLSEFLTGVGGELDDMAHAGGGSGYATQVVRQVGDRASSWGSQLRDQGSGDLLQQTRSFARRKPGTFLLGALVAGVVAGRLSRGAKAHHDEQSATPAPETGNLDGFQTGTRPTEPFSQEWAPVADPAQRRP